MFGLGAELIGGLGLGGQLAVSATMIMAAFYLWRAQRVASIVVALFATGAGYVLVLLIAAAFAIAAGWIDPNPGRIGEHVGRGIGLAWELVRDRLVGGSL